MPETNQTVAVEVNGEPVEDAVLCTVANGCNIRTKFKLHHIIIRVVKDIQAFVQAKEGERVVLVGSEEHILAISGAIDEITGRILELEEKLKNASPEKHDHIQLKLNKLLKLKSERLYELAFIKENCKPDDDQATGELDEQETADDGDGIPLDDSTYDGETRTSETEEEEVVVHFTVEEFGQTNLKLIELPHQDNKLFTTPVLRQYFINRILHREKDHHKVSWLELFIDLIYVGGIAKSGKLFAANYNAQGCIEYSLALTTLIMYWRSGTYLNNRIKHEDLTRKLFTIIQIAVLILICITQSHAFDLDYKSNTGDILVGAYIVGSMLHDIYYIFGGLFAFTFVRYSTVILGLVNWICMIPLFIFLGFPANGTYERDALRKSIWGTGLLMQILLTPIVYVSFASIKAIAESQYGIGRMAINIEHISERNGLLIVIVLGEVVVGLLNDFSMDLPPMILLYQLLSFITALNLFFMYFRVETAKHVQHAMRRSAVTGFLWSIIHIPLAISIVGMGIGIYRLVSQIALPVDSKYEKLYMTRAGGTVEADKIQHQFFYCISFTVYYVCIGLLGLSHNDIDNRDGTKHTYKAKIPILSRVIFRIVIAIGWAVLSVVLEMKAGPWIILGTCVTLFTFGFEEYARIVYRKRKAIEEAKKV
ncbi:hypothetical protein HDV02_002569 [Globomyces sp. JEL0801]|nr:hypothetical protein HDV02_002569 [Globomyces sp. JEL0801]